MKPQTIDYVYCMLDANFVIKSLGAGTVLTVLK